MEKYDVDESGQLDFGEFLRLFWCAQVNSARSFAMQNPLTCAYVGSHTLLQGL